MLQHLREDNNEDISSKNNKIPIILDCDPGHDDAFALILAIFNEKIDLLGVTTVSGNQTLEKTTLNASRILYACGVTRSLPLAKGCDGPLVKYPRNFQLNTTSSKGDLNDHPTEVHGESGMDGAEFPDDINVSLCEKHAVFVMAELIERHATRERPVHIVCVGPLTNISLFIKLYPKLHKFIRIVLMGGSFCQGNVQPTSEFNINYDPIAAHIVFHSNIPITMLPLDLTHQVLVTEEVSRKISSLSSTFSQTMLGLLNFFQSTYRDVFGISYPPLHDPCAVAYLVDPSKFETTHIRVDVEISPGLCTGQTIGYFHWKRPGCRKNVDVAMKVDVEWFWEIMLQALKKADQNSYL
ncbi:hypothetical protein GpartN1_g7264.t1 [Galdieria partita]|uniref:Inosine/uridine-preferring nucleoside hydrolase domain-containing protein n=1 Tax=Galdieria partita TaxID=83374 RepID=A0A9C7UU25_9RHOD|nr:hypothetical protein GpartN1_g7264.t1 [Galdieria partita]